MQFADTQNGVHQHWITNWREFQRVPQSASTCLCANCLHARFFGLPSCARCLASCERRHCCHCELDVTAVLSLACGLFCIPWQTPLVGPLDSSERTFCQYTNANFHRKKSADMLEKSAHLTVLAIVPIASFEANTEHGILPHFLKRNRHK